ncbi:hypothetical protein HMN09_01082900 [Mycena chlorophos]|uniref:F-box domain-containing protein n=1 Tax=Mycena chlorophos TaxID=658473 RepID=A0A8H6SDG4_MYCCL|nr:hypothetical protein HMN09_01082900 [Mycena chlorophos]
MPQAELERSAIDGSCHSADDRESRKLEEGSGWLPVELVEVILSFAIDPSGFTPRDGDPNGVERNDPRATLAAASLVCSAWLGPARKYLFRRVSIFLWNAHAFGNFFPLGGDDAQQFPTFPAQIHSLQLFGELNSNSWMTSVLPKILSSFTALNTLIISTELPKPDFLPCSLGQCIQHLELRGSQTWKTPQASIHLDQLIASFPHLETLMVDEFDFSFAGMPLVLPPMGLRKIRLNNNAIDILKWIIDRGGGSVISDLQIFPWVEESFGDLSCFGRLPSLENLTLCFVSANSIDVFLSRPLPPLPPIHTLAIHADHTRLVALFLHLIAHFPTPHLTTLSLTFTFDVRNPGPIVHRRAAHGMLQLLFDQLDTALASLPSLDRRKLIIKKMEAGPTAPNIAKVIDMRSWLPKTYAGMESVPYGADIRAVGSDFAAGSPGPQREWYDYLWYYP